MCSASWGSGCQTRSPDETTILNFRHRLEAAALGTGLLEVINRQLQAEGLQLRPQSGTIVDASIISAPSSTKNRANARDPEMHQTRKGNQWYFGMKLHIGVDAETGIVHSLHTTAANVSDITAAPDLLHGGETLVCGDAGYQGIAKRLEQRERAVQWQVAMRPGKRRLLDPEGEEWLEEKRKASVRAKVEHPFQIVKLRFGYAKVRYRGLFKNTQRLALLLGLANVVRAERNLLRNKGPVRPKSRSERQTALAEPLASLDQAAFLTIKRPHVSAQPRQPHFAASSELP